MSMSNSLGEIVVAIVSFLSVFISGLCIGIMIGKET